MLQPPCAENYLCAINSKSDRQYPHRTDIATHTKTKTIEKHDTNNCLHQVICQRHPAHRNQPFPFCIATGLYPLETEPRHISQAKWSDTNGIEKSISQSQFIRNT